MKIVHALAYFGNYKGGLQLYVQNLAKKQLEEGHDVKIITSSYYGNQKNIEGIPIIRVKALFSAFRVPFTPMLPLILLREECDILHAHLPLPWLDISCVVKKFFHKKTKFIITLHNYLPTKSIISKIFAFIHNKFLISSAIYFSDRIITTTNEFAQSLPYHIPQSKHVNIPLGVDTEHFNMQSQNEFNKFQVLFVGRLIPEKGLDILVKAMKIVTKKIPEARLLALCSETYNYSQFEKELERIGRNYLTIKKNVSHKRMPIIYQQSSVLVMPSIDLDSFGYVLLEAMACGCPVITTDLPGPSSVVDKMTGLVVKRGHINDLSTAIIKALKKINYDRTEISKSTEEKYSFNNIFPKIMEAYQ